MDRQRQEYVVRSAVTALFLVAIALPLPLTLILPAETVSLAEQRFLAPPPSWPDTPAGMRHLPAAVSGWIDDHFALREELVQLNQFVLRAAQAGILSSAPVLEGEDGWLYFAGDRALEDFQGRMPFTRAELDAWTDLLVQKQHWLEARGIPYLFVIAPNKQSIYPEHLPGWLAGLRGETRAEQLARHLVEHTDLPMLDLRPGLLSHKGTALLYRRLDSHWNMRGADIARSLMLQEITARYPELSVAPAPGGRWRDREASGGDLARAIGRGELTETVPRWWPVHRRCRLNLSQAGQKEIGGGAPLVDECDQPAADALVFRDSFMIALRPLLTPHFRRSVYVWERPDPCMLERLVQEYRPGIVIEQMVERKLVLPPPACPAD